MKDDEGVLWYKGRICVTNIKELKDKILREAHKSSYSIGGTEGREMLSTMLPFCNTCQRVKAEHQQPIGLSQPLQVPECKCKDIAFIMGLPRTEPRYDSL
jgi:hypothetical protein